MQSDHGRVDKISSCIIGGLSSESPMIPVATAGDCGASDGVVMREVNANIQESVQVISSRGAQLHKLFLMRFRMLWVLMLRYRSLMLPMKKEATFSVKLRKETYYLEELWFRAQVRTMNASASDLGRVCNEALVTTTLVTTNGDREGRPFHFIATWQDHPQFEDFLRNTWDMTVDVESNVSLFAEEARHWNDTMFKIIGPKKRELLARIRGMGRALSKNHSNFLVQLDIDLRAELDEVLQHEESLWLQKSRVN
ncbi:hypothetical protein V6N13_056948 [Hibiscus sabdariffa]